MAVVTYCTQADLEGALSPSTVLALFDDDQSGTVSTTAMTLILKRATTWVDSFLSRVFPGTYPIAQTPVPDMVNVTAIEFAIAFSFERHPEYVQTYGEQYRASTRFQRACELAEALAQSKQEIPGWVTQGQSKAVGGIITVSGPRTIVDSPDGTSNGGDF